MNFKLAETLFFFTIKASKFLLEYIKPQLKEDLTDSEKLAHETGKMTTLIASIFEDKKINFEDFPEILELLKESTFLYNFDFSQAANEISNASLSDLENVFRKFDDEFILSDKGKEKDLEKIFHQLFIIINSTKIIIDICKRIKK